MSSINKGNQQAPPKRAKATERQLQALELRKAGLGYQAIADNLGYRSASGAHKAVLTAIKKVLQEPAEEVRKMELERLDAMLYAIWDKVQDGNGPAVDKALRIMERRSRYLGLDAPVKSDVTSAGKPIVFNGEVAIGTQDTEE